MFFCVLDNNDIPFSLWNQATAKLTPKPDYEEPATYYVTSDCKLIERFPIIQKDRIGQATNALEEYCQAWTDTFKSKNPIV